VLEFLLGQAVARPDTRNAAARAALVEHPLSPERNACFSALLAVTIRFVRLNGSGHGH